MNKIKHMPPWIGYTHVDSLAKLLEEQAAAGWRFKAFRFGLEFERSFPADEHYDVQVFSGNTELDTRPEHETEEFSDYCLAAGWELVDSSRKLTVFRKIRNDAVPIFTEEEKLEEVFNAEKKRRLWSFISALLIAFSYGIQLSQFPGRYLFSGDILFALSFLLIMVTILIVRFPLIFLWREKKRKELDEKGHVFFGGRDMFMPLVYMVIWVVVFTYLCRALLGGIVPIYWIFIAGVILSTIVPSILRLSRDANLIMQIFVPFGVILLVIALGISNAVSEEKSLPAADDASLMLSDICEIKGELNSINFEKDSSFLGEYEIQFSTYHAPGYDEMKDEWIKEHGAAVPVPQDPDGQSFKLDFYSSKSSFLIDIIENSEKRFVKKYLNSAENVTKEWDADEALLRVVGGSFQYYVRYDKSYLHLIVDERLTAEQINIVRERLGI